MNFTELTDPDGDALTITSDSAGTWITCSSGIDEVTVGPFPTDALSTTLAQGHLSMSQPALVTRRTTIPVATW
jgi:hypothetical protein